MARVRSTSAANSISLFPFLSILACVIGSLTLIISALSIAQIAVGREDADVARAEDYVALENEVEKDRAELEKLREETALENKELAGLRKLQAEAAAMRKELGELEKTRAERAKLATQAKAVAVEIANLAAGGSSLSEQIAAMEKKRIALEDEAGAERRVQILPSRGISRIAPSFVEVAKDGLVLHTRSASIKVERGKIATDPNLKKLVAATQRAERGTLVLLLRPDGYSTYSTFRGVARSKGWPYAKLPLITTGPIDLKLFNIDR